MNMRLLLTVLFLCGHAGIAQIEMKVNVDSLFSSARQQAFAGKRDSAQMLLYRILDQSPSYSDVRIFLARTLGWDRKFDEARKEIQTVLAQNPKSYEGYIAAVDVEQWDSKNNAALSNCEQALQFYPTDESLLLKKAELLHALHREEEALLALLALEQINRAHPELPKLRQAITVSSLSQEISLQEAADSYSHYFAPSHLLYLQYHRRTAYGTLIGRVNYRIRGNRSGTQGEVDAYPLLTDGMYAYLNYGFAGSSSLLFPQHRAGLELYVKLPSSSEASLGGRYLSFSRGKDVTLYTGSLGYYYKDFWFSLRPFLTPNNLSFSRSLGFTARWYYNGTPEEFLSARISAGFSPDERHYDPLNGNIYYLKAQSFGTWWQKPLGMYSLLTLSFDVTNQELIFKPGGYVKVYSISAGYRYKF
jgi:YaiO family outer membrane protein